MFKTTDLEDVYEGKGFVVSINNLAKTSDFIKRYVKVGFPIRISPLNKEAKLTCEQYDQLVRYEICHILMKVIKELRGD